MIKLLDLLKEDNPFVSRGGEKRAEKYSEKEIRAMVPNVNGGIIIKYSTI